MAKIDLELMIIIFVIVGSFSKTHPLQDSFTRRLQLVPKTMDKLALQNSKVVLRSSNGEAVEVDEKLCSESETLQRMIPGNPSKEGILLENITSETLGKVINYYDKYFEASNTDHGNEDFKNWEAEFVKVDYKVLFELILATNELNLKQLYDLTAGTVGKMMLGKSTRQIRKMFNITCEITPADDKLEEEEDNKWAYE